MEQRAADEFAREWIAAWNSRDPERMRLPADGKAREVPAHCAADPGA